MKNQNRKYLLLGLIMGILLTLSISPISAVTQTITAYLRPDFQFYFNGTHEPVPEGQAVLVYEGRSYVPAKFVAEALGAEVLWSDASKSIFINLEEPVVEEPVDEVEEPEEQEEEEDDNLQPSGNYRKLPVFHRDRDFELNANYIALPDDEYDQGILRVPGTRIYVEFENFGGTPLQIRQGEVWAVVDGKEYRASDISAAYRDSTWYSDVRRDDVSEGYLILPTIPTDSKEMKLYVTVLFNDYRQNTREVELDILLDLD